MLKLFQSSIGGLLIKALIAFGVIAYILMLQSTNKANAQIIKASETQIAHLQAANDAEKKASDELRYQLQYHESLAIERQQNQNSIDLVAVSSKQELNALIEESDNEKSIVWADELVPDVVVSMLIETAGNNYSNANNTSNTTNEFIAANIGAGIHRQNKSRSG